MDNRKLSIKVSIDGKQLSLTVADAEEEKVYRDAASMCQSKIQQFRAIYPNVPNDSYYYLMAMLTTAVEATHISNRHDTGPFLETMEDLEKEIDQLIKK
ncbi:MAG: cell division protein ZapA [Bacteroidaceae bacterium]|nr:cell division protein ZapA [Bacteroidaceae bacterium]